MVGLKKLIIIIVATVGAILIFIFQRGLYSQPAPQSANWRTQPSPNPQTSQTSSNEEPKVISTNPENFDGSIILPNQTIEITFNRPLENVGELKYQIDPKTDVVVKLSNDRKTAIITPSTPYKLGAGFTLFIKTDSKFDGGKRLDHELIYHFNTIGYKGV